MARHKRGKRPLMRAPDLRPPPGSAPGTLVADPDALKPVIRVIAYGPKDLEETTIEDPEELREIVGRLPVTWVNVDGLGDPALISRLGEIFGLHRLALEDVVHLRQRPRVEDYGQHLFLVTQMTRLTPKVENEQVSLFLGPDFLLTFQERPGDCFDPVRERIQKSGARIRESKPDYLAYALIDAVIDTYFPLLEHFGEKVDELESAVLQAPEEGLIPRIHELKMDLLSLRRIIWPQRDMANTMIRDFSELIEEQTRVYLRDCYDHTIQLLDMVETYRELASGLIELYLSGVSQRSNDIMKVLTIIATIFIPLGFIAGLYGMNFDSAVSPWNMPELGWAWGYPFALALMAAVAIALLLYFRKRGWIGSGDKSSP